MPIVHPLAPIALSETQRGQAEAVRERLMTAYDSLVSILPPGRLKSLALTALEQCTMWAVKSVAHDGGPAPTATTTGGTRDE